MMKTFQKLHYAHMTPRSSVHAVDFPDDSQTRLHHASSPLSRRDDFAFPQFENQEIHRIISSARLMLHEVAAGR